MLKEPSENPSWSHGKIASCCGLLRGCLIEARHKPFTDTVLMFELLTKHCKELQFLKKYMNTVRLWSIKPKGKRDAYKEKALGRPLSIFFPSLPSPHDFSLTLEESRTGSTAAVKRELSIFREQACGLMDRPLWGNKNALQTDTFLPAFGSREEQRRTMPFIHRHGPLL